jgi:hypothetical protein
MTLELTDDEAALLLKELNSIIDGDRYFLSDRIRTLKAIRAKIRPEPAPELYHHRRSVMPHRGRVRRGDEAEAAEATVRSIQARAREDKDDREQRGDHWRRGAQNAA